MSEETTSIAIDETVVVSDLADQLDISVGVLIGELIKSGVMVTLNDRIDFDTAAIVTQELGFELTKKVQEKKSTSLKSKLDLTDKAQLRPPVVAVMGHVDHGKTTLLDAIRDADVAKGEAGGITQHLSAYQIKYQDRKITFLDTPGHEAFAALREHGASLTDVAIIVVAANDGVMPQTKQAIEYAQKAGVPMVIAINKIDAPGADVNKTKTQLSEANLTPEDWGGDVVMVEVSALKKDNIDKLLDMVLLVADIEEHKAEYEVSAEGIVIESHMATGRGPVATLLVEHGQIKPGTVLVVNDTYAKVKVLENDRGQTVEKAGPSMPVTVIGFKDVPVFGQRFQEVDSEKVARKVAASNKNQRSSDTGVVKSATESDLLSQIDTEKAAQKLNVILKADVQGSLESLIQSLEHMGNKELGFTVVSSGIGDITKSDISAAEASGAVVYGFNVGITSTVRKVASKTNTTVKIFKVIYELLDDAKQTLEENLVPEIVETELGKLKVKGVFRTTQKRIICGGQVTTGKLTSQTLAKLMRGDEELGFAEIASVQKGQETAKEVLEGDMCGMELKTEEKINLKPDDIILCIKREQVKRSLA